MTQRNDKIVFISEQSNETHKHRVAIHPKNIISEKDEIYKYANHEIYIDLLNSKEDREKILQFLDDIGRDFHVDVRNFTRSLTPRNRDGFISFRSKLTQKRTFLLKRAIDIVAAITASVILSPILILTAFLIKITSNGPIFFRQKRIGLHGREFTMYKFRSMVSNAESLKTKLTHLNKRNGPTFKIDDDPRITKVGKIIRKHSIDEFPQLYNIIAGDMSIVGPRPPLKEEFEQYDAWQKRRLSVPPGLTCYWQILKNKDIDFTQWVNLDLKYIDSWSIWTDLSIIYKTIPEVIFGRKSN